MRGLSQPSGAQRQNSLDKIKTLERVTGRMLDMIDEEDNSRKSQLQVAVRVRPILKSGVRASEAHQKDIMRVADGNMVVVLDPDDEKAYLDQVQGRTKEKHYAFDAAFDKQARNVDVYNGTVKDMVLGCMRGQNVTVFAYGATGSGKTHTMVGTDRDPGLMVLSLKSIFNERGALGEDGVQITCSYIEVYNEVVYDLLIKNSPSLELREDPKQGVCVAGIKRHSVSTPGEIMALLQEGNRRRKTDSTSANATSSRSHAVLEIRVTRKAARNPGKGKGKSQNGKLCLVDLAGSERAAETDNRGQKLRDGANINKSLLALANCINALGKASQGKGGKAYVPYRNSKLTRLLKDGLSGKCSTAMIATVSASADQYMNSINTLKYADRAKEIKAEPVQPKKPAKSTPKDRPVEKKVSDEYQGIISDLQLEVQDLKEQLEALHLESQLAVPDANMLGQCGEMERLMWLNKMSADINANSEERINLQKALLELEDSIVCNRADLEQLEEYIEAGGLSRAEAASAQERIAAYMGNINDLEREVADVQFEMTGNDEQRRDLQQEIEAAMESNPDSTFLQVVMSFRMQAARVQELQFQSAVRDQVISEQRGVINNLWKVIEGSGLSNEDIEAIGRANGMLLGAGPSRMGLPNQQSKGGIKQQGTGLLGGLLRTIQRATNRAQARYDFRRFKEGIGATAAPHPDEIPEAFGTAAGPGTAGGQQEPPTSSGGGGFFASIRNTLFGGGRKTTKVKSTKVVAVSPAPLPELPAGRF